MLKFLSVVTVLIVTASSTGAIAQHSGSDAEQKACSRDVTRFCRPLLDQGDFAILACLQQNRVKLTAACKQVLVNHGQ